MTTTPRPLRPLRLPAAPIRPPLPPRRAAADPSLSGKICADGSSTVGPLTTAAAEAFGAANPGVQVTVGISGTGGGFEKFCAGETDLSDASRPIKDEEKTACESKGIKFHELLVANDGITVVVNKDNDWAKCLTVDQLKTMWGPDSKASSWKDIDPSFPDESLKLYGPGTDSGTFDFFTAAINGEGAPRAPTTRPPRTTTSPSRASAARRVASVTSASRTTSKTRIR